MTRKRVSLTHKPAAPLPKTPAPSAQESKAYRTLEAQVRERFQQCTVPVFTTSADPDKLWEDYLGGLEETRRQHYTCKACARFVKGFGGLVTVSDDGELVPLAWAGEPNVPVFFFRDSVDRMIRRVSRSKITGVFLSDSATLGIPATMGPDREWSHLHGRLQAQSPSHVLNAGPKAAAMLQDYEGLRRSLGDYPRAVVEQAVRALKNGALARPEKALGHAEWFLGLVGKGVNELWAAVAKAPPGWCHVRSAVLGTLLDDVKSGIPFEDVAARWGAKMDPDHYMRPTAAPKAGAIEQAERLVSELGIERSLERRYATLEDVQVRLWTPTPLVGQPGEGGVFGHLRERAAAVKPLELPNKNVSWAKFRREILPGTKRLEVWCPRTRGSYYGLVVGTHEDAPPILQWDELEHRNTVSHYVYSEGSSASQWGLVQAWAGVSAVFLSPHAWRGEDRFPHQTTGVHFAISLAHDTKEANGELALFPEMLRSELHGVRKVLEAHSKKGGRITGTGSANGVCYHRGSDNPVRLRADNAEFTLVLWD